MSLFKKPTFRTKEKLKRRLEYKAHWLKKSLEKITFKK